MDLLTAFGAILKPPLPNALTRLTRDRVSLVALAIITALAVGAAQTNVSAQVSLTGAVDASWRGAYDILVRPPASQLGVEQTNGLIEPNFLDYGANTRGISLDKLAEIRALPGVEVAAPVSVIGYVLSSALNPQTAITNPPAQPTVYRLTLTTSTSDGLQTLELNRQQATILVDTTTLLTTPPIVGTIGGGSSSSDSGGDSLGWLVLPPLRTEIIGVDPIAEQELLGPRGSFLDPLVELPSSRRGDLTSRSFDCSLDAAALAVLGSVGCVPQGPSTQAPVVPLVVSARLPAALTMSLQVDQLGATIPTSILPTESETSSTDAYTIMDRLVQAAGPGVTRIGTTQRDLTTLIQPFGPQDLRTVFPGSSLADSIIPVTNGSPVDFSALVPERPMYRVTEARPGSSAVTFQVSALGPVNANGDPAGTHHDFQLRLPAAAYQIGLDAGYRALVSRPLAVMRLYTPPGPGQPSDVPYYADAVGTFDPADLAAADATQDPLAYVPLGAYAPADSELVARPDGTALPTPAKINPTLNPAGFIAAPPSAITDLLGATLLRGPDPIDAIRVRVGGLTGFDSLSRAKVEQVASAIRALGLDVQIVAGSSPQPVEVYVPDHFVNGPPSRDLGYVRQHWTSLGAAQSVETGLGGTNSALLFLALAVALAMAAGIALIRLAGRTADAAILRAIGWSDARIARFITADALVACLLVESASFIVWVAGSRASARADPAGLAVGFALAATLPVAASAAAVLVLHRLGPSARDAGETWRGVPTGGWLRVRGPLSLGLRAVLARPARSLVTVVAVGLAAGATALGGLAVATSYVGQTLLANAVSQTLHPYQILLLVLVAGSGILLALSVQRLDRRDRTVELQVLSAAGWTPGQIRLSLQASRLVLSLAAAPIAASVGALGAIPVSLTQPERAALLAAGLAFTLVVWGGLAGGAPRPSRGAGRGRLARP